MNLEKNIIYIDNKEIANKLMVELEKINLTSIVMELPCKYNDIDYNDSKMSSMLSMDELINSEALEAESTLLMSYISYDCIIIINNGYEYFIENILKYKIYNQKDIVALSIFLGVPLASILAIHRFCKVYKYIENKPGKLKMVSSRLEKMDVVSILAETTENIDKFIAELTNLKIANPSLNTDEIIGQYYIAPKLEAGDLSSSLYDLVVFSFSASQFIAIELCTAMEQVEIKSIINMATSLFFNYKLVSDVSEIIRDIN